jgi:hypothetical protein
MTARAAGPSTTDEERIMSLKDAGLLLGIFVLWIVLNRWVLPWFGIRTCMSGACGVDARPATTAGFPEEAKPGEDSP